MLTGVLIIAPWITDAVSRGKQQSRTGILPVRRTCQRDQRVGFADGDRQDACPTLKAKSFPVGFRQHGHRVRRLDIDLAAFKRGALELGERREGFVVISQRADFGGARQSQ